MTEEAIDILKDCFEWTDWQVFRDATTTGNQVNVEEYFSVVMAYVSKCMEDVALVWTSK